MGELGWEIDYKNGMEEIFSIHGIVEFGSDRRANRRGGKV